MLAGTAATGVSAGIAGTSGRAADLRVGATGPAARSVVAGAASLTTGTTFGTAIAPLFTVPGRFAEIGDLHEDIDDHVFDIAPLLEWADRDEAEGKATPDEPEEQH